MVAAIYTAVGRLGFYPTDEGLVLAYAYRVLHGQVPHRDFISPRPLGSGLLHTLDFLVPGPLFEVSRVIALCEYAGYAVLFGCLISRRAPWRWTVAMAAGVAGSILVNLNVFPIMAWYTVDGLLLIAAGFVLVDRGVARASQAMIGAGFMLIGAAALTKQSFVPAAAFGWLLLWPVLRRATWTSRIRWLVVTGLLAAAPSVAFIAAIAVLGGFRPLLTQVLGGGFVYGRPLLAAWSPRHDLVWLVAAAGGVAIVAAGLERVKAGAAAIGLRIVITAAVLAPPLAGGFGASQADWGIVELWIAIAFWSARLVAARKLEPAGLALIGCAWMTTLSYGYAVPDLVCGTLALYVLHATWSGAKLPATNPWKIVPAVAAIAAFAVTAYGFDAARLQDVYHDRPAAQLTASLASVSPAFGDIRTNPNTAEYLMEMKACVARFPARRVAIISENAAMYVAFSLDNPFPIDWIWPYDIHGSEQRIVATADELNREGDYLVMFQTAGQPDVVRGSGLAPATSQSAIYSETALPSEILARLKGTRTTCGPFVVVYSPA